MNNEIKKIPLKCPSCDSTLSVNRFHCKCCGTEVSGDFPMPLLASISAKEQSFILDFVKASGSLKDMAKNLGVSYPTVRNILDDLIEKLKNMEEQDHE